MNKTILALLLSICTQVVFAGESICPFEDEHFFRGYFSVEENDTKVTIYGSNKVNNGHYLLGTQSGEPASLTINKDGQKVGEMHLTGGSFPHSKRDGQVHGRIDLYGKQYTYVCSANLHQGVHPLSENL